MSKKKKNPARILAGVQKCAPNKNFKVTLFDYIHYFDMRKVN